MENRVPKMKSIPISNSPLYDKRIYLIAQWKHQYGRRSYTFSINRSKGKIQQNYRRRTLSLLKMSEN